MGLPNRLIDLFRPSGSRRLCPDGEGDRSAANCSYCQTVKGMTCACCPLLCEMLLPQTSALDRPSGDFATAATEVRGRDRKEASLALRRFRRPDTRTRIAWLSSSRVAPAVDHRILTLLAVAVLPGFWVWPLRGHIKAGAVSLLSLVRRNKSVREIHRRGRLQRTHSWIRVASIDLPFVASRSRQVGNRIGSRSARDEHDIPMTEFHPV